MPSESLPVFQKLQREWTDWLREPELRPRPAGVAPDRLQTYRELLFNNVSGFVENTFPILQSLLPEALWQRLCREFFAHHHCQTPYFHEIAQEFMAFFNGLDWPELEAYPWARELVHYEWVELAADIAEAGAQVPVHSDGDLLLGMPCVSSLAWPLLYHWPVHRFAEEGAPDVKPPEPTCLLLYRDYDDHVQCMVINPLTAHLLELLRSNDARSGREVLESLAAEAGFADVAAFVAAGRQILADLHQVGVILGTKA